MKKNNNNKITPIVAVLSSFFFLFILIVINANDSGNSIKTDNTDDVTKYNYDSVYDSETDDDEDTDNTQSSLKPKKDNTTQKKKKQTPKKKSKKQKIKDIIEDRIWEYDYTDVDSISINKDYGTKTKNDYIALVNLTWEQKNSASLSKEMISMYSEDLAAFVGKKCKNVHEICIFWTVPYLNDASAKCSYERKHGGMYSTDTIFDYNFD